MAQAVGADAAGLPRAHPRFTTSMRSAWEQDAARRAAPTARFFLLPSAPPRRHSPTGPPKPSPRLGRRSRVREPRSPYSVAQAAPEAGVRADVPSRPIGGRIARTRRSRALTSPLLERRRTPGRPTASHFVPTFFFGSYMISFLRNDRSDEPSSPPTSPSYRTKSQGAGPATAECDSERSAGSFVPRDRLHRAGGDAWPPEA